MSVKVIAQLNPFSIEKHTFTFTDHESIKEIIEAIGPYEASMARVLINDEIITDFDRIAEDGATVYLKFVPEGGGDTKQTGQKMGGWGAVTFGLGLTIAFLTGWTGIGLGIGTALMGAGVSMMAGGVALYSYDADSYGSRESPEQRPSIRGSRNRENQYGYIPVVFGKHLIYPDLAAKSYTLVDGNDQWLVQLFCAGYKDIVIDNSTFKLGDTKLTEYSATRDINQILAGLDSVVKLEVIQSGATSTLYPKVCRENQINGIIKNKRDDGTDGDVVYTTADKTTSLNVDIFFYNGLGRYNDDGDVVSRSVEVVAYYKMESDPDSAYVSFGAWDGVGGTVISGSELKTKRYQVSKTGLTAGAYTVKLVRVTADTTDTKIVDAVYLGSIRAFSNEPPVRPGRAVDLTILALKVKATDRLSNTIDTLNFIAQSRIPAYSGSGTGSSAWATTTTRNPAAMLKYVLQGRINSVPVDNADIDWASLEAWGTWCDAHNYECNAVVSGKMTLSDLTMAIANTGRAETVKIDSKFSVVQDIARASPVQLFTPRNTKSYQQTIAYTDIPDAIELGFIDETAGYADNDRIVYNTDDGEQGENEPETKQGVNLWGITNPDQAFLIGRYQYACMKLRPRFHRIEADFEYLMCTKGDRIQYAGDTALVGTAYGRIKETTLFAGNIIQITLDEYVTIESGKSYGMRVRKANGELTLINIHASIGYTNVFDLDTPLPEASGPKALDLVALGERGFETLDLVIMDINTIDDWNASLSCVDYSPEIFNVDDPDYVIPAFESLITIGGVVDSGVVNPSEWKLFETYHDSLVEPALPIGDGSTNGWHWTNTQESKWKSTKTGKNRSDGSWGPPIATAKQVSEELKHGTDNSIPLDVSEIIAIARQDYIDISISVLTNDTLDDTPSSYRYEISKDEGTTWTPYESSLPRFAHNFNRSTDGYPEKDTGTNPLTSWRVRAKSVNIYGNLSLGYGPSAAGVTLDLSTYKTWIPQVPVISKLSAKEEGLEYEIFINTSSFYGSFIRFDVSLNSSIRIANSSELSGIIPFDRAVDGYPEKNDERTVHQISGGISLEDFAVTVKVKTDEHQGTISAIKNPDVSSYKTWIPHLPFLAVSAAGRKITLAMQANNDVYGNTGFRIQIRKETLTSRYALGNSSDAYSNEESYRSGEVGGYSFTTLATYDQAVPLENQSADLPQDTGYYYRIAAVNIPLQSLGSVYITPWTDDLLAVAKATSIRDIGVAAVKNAQLGQFAVTADKVAVHTLTAEQLNVVARNKINSFHNSADELDGWNVHTSAQIVSVDANNPRVLRLVAPNAGFTTDQFEVQPNELVEFSFGVRCENYTSGSGIFLGLTSADAYTQYVWNFNLKKWELANTGTNKYFISDYRHTTRRNFRTYILGFNVNISDVPAPATTDTVYSISCLKLSAGKTSTTFRSGYNATVTGTYWDLFQPQAYTVGASKIVAEQILVTNLSAINSKLGEIVGDDDDNYKLVMGSDGSAAEGTLLLGATTDDAYFRRYKSNGVWFLDIKTSNFIVTSVASTIVGPFYVKSTGATPDSNSLVGLFPSTGEIKLSGAKISIIGNVAALSLATVATAQTQYIRIANIAWNTECEIDLCISGANMQDTATVRVHAGNASTNMIEVTYGRNNLSYGLAAVYLYDNGGSYNSTRTLWVAVSRIANYTAAVAVRAARSLDSSMPDFSVLSIQALTGTQRAQILTSSSSGMGVSNVFVNGAMEIVGGTDVSLSAGSGMLFIGSRGAQHIAIDNDEIQSKANGTAAGALHINIEGGTVYIGKAGHAVRIGGNLHVAESLTAGSLKVTSGTDVSLTAGSGYVLIGDASALHIAIDNNEIQSKMSGTEAGSLYINCEGGAVYISKAGHPVQVEGTLRALGEFQVGGAGTLFRVTTSGDFLGGPDAAPTFSYRAATGYINTAAIRMTTTTVGIGKFAGSKATGEKNTCFGYGAGSDIVSGVGNTCIGAYANVGGAGQNNCMALGCETSTYGPGGDHQINLNNRIRYFEFPSGTAHRTVYNVISLYIKASVNSYVSTMGAYTVEVCKIHRNSSSSLVFTNIGDTTILAVDPTQYTTYLGARLQVAFVVTV